MNTKNNQVVINIVQKLKPFVCLLLLFLTAFSCREQKTKWKGTIEEVDGITVVKNPKEPIYEEDVLSLVEELSIGDAEGREEYMFSQIGNLAVDDEGSIYVLDRKDFHIKVYDKNGEYLRTFGRKGQGPGELNRPFNISITPQNEIMVEDYRVIHFYTFQGEFIKSLFVAKVQFFSRASMDSKGNIYAMTATMNMEEGKSSYELKKFDPNLNFLLTVSSIPGPTAGEPFDPFMPLFFFDICENDYIIYGYQKNYEFLIFNTEGKLVKKITKEHKPLKITEKEKEESPGDDLPPLKYALSVFHTAFYGFSLDYKDRIIVKTWEKTEDKKQSYYDVFDSEGKYIAKIALENHPRIWKNHKLYTIEEDEQGYQYVKRYRFIWKI